MRGKRLCNILLVSAGMLLCSCSISKSSLVQYYSKHQKVLDSIEASYKNLYRLNPFSIGFTDRSFNYVSVTIITDTLQYIYDFGVDEPRLKDTLSKYELNETAVIKLIKQMRTVHCTWINNLVYYENTKAQPMTFISIRPIALHAPFMYKKYYILAYFSQPQYFDSEGRLFAGKRKRRLRKINDEVFLRLNDKVCYTISENFR